MDIYITTRTTCTTCVATLDLRQGEWIDPCGDLTCDSTGDLHTPYMPED